MKLSNISAVIATFSISAILYYFKEELKRMGIIVPNWVIGVIGFSGLIYVAIKEIIPPTYRTMIEPYTVYILSIWIAIVVLSLIFQRYQLLRKERDGLPKVLPSLASLNNTIQGIDSIKSEFANRLSRDIAALKSPKNVQIDAYGILEKKFDKQHAIYIKLRNSLDAPNKDRFSEAWQAYYGEDGEQKWWLPNEYSTLLSNQLKNTAENTKQLAINRIEKILKLCR